MGKMYHCIFFIVSLRTHIKNSCFVFHQWFQTPRGNKSTQPVALCFYLFLGVGNPWWNTCTRFCYITFQHCLRELGPLLPKKFQSLLQGEYGYFLELHVFLKSFLICYLYMTAFHLTETKIDYGNLIIQWSQNQVCCYFDLLNFKFRPFYNLNLSFFCLQFMHCTQVDKIAKLCEVIMLTSVEFQLIEMREWTEIFSQQWSSHLIVTA